MIPETLTGDLQIYCSKVQAMVHEEAESLPPHAALECSKQWQVINSFVKRSSMELSFLAQYGIVLR